MTARFHPQQEEFRLESADAYEVDHGENNTANPPQEFLATLNPSGLPPHLLLLRKEGMPLIPLLRNLNPSEGLCNGTKLCLRDIHTYTNSPSKLRSLLGSILEESYLYHATPSECGLCNDHQ